MKTLSITLLAACMLFSCSTGSVVHEGTAPNDSLRYQRFAWLPDSVPRKDIRVNNPTVEGYVHRAVEKELNARGYSKTEVNQADFLIIWFGSIDEEVKDFSISHFYSRYGYATLAGAMPENPGDTKVQKVFKRGTLILDVIDARTKSVIWRGSATNTIQEQQMNELEAKKYIDRSVKKILEDIPNR